MTSATDVLLRLLDERGVEHYDGTESTLWDYEQTSDSTGCYRCSADEIRDGFVNVWMHHLTPQQAIDATLGRGTCRDVGRYAFVCSECGWASDEPHHVLGGFWPKYCPECGRAVVW